VDIVYSQGTCREIAVISFPDIVVAIQVIMHLTTIIGLAGTCMVTAFSGNHTTTDFNNLTVALVRAPPANWPLALMNKNWTGVKFDLNNTVDKGVDLIKVAAQNGANLIVFPELWFPGYVTLRLDQIGLQLWSRLTFFPFHLLFQIPQRHG
jgi:hypothetical protein